MLHFFERVGKYSWKFGQMAGNDVCLQSGNHPRGEIGEMRGGTSVSSGGILASYISHLAIFILIFLDGLLYSHLPYISYLSLTGYQMMQKFSHTLKNHRRGI